MKKRDSSRSAFFIPRVLIGLFIVLAGASLALLASGALAASSPSFVKAQQKYSALNYGGDPLVPAGFDCSKIHELGIDKQKSLRAGAIMIFCDEAQGGKPGEARSSSAFSKLVQKLTAPMVYGGPDVDLITGDKSFPNITQSETFTTANRITPTRSSSATLTHEALRPCLPTVLAHRSQPMVAIDLPA